jgi:hypothetical protein
MQIKIMLTSKKFIPNQIGVMHTIVFIKKSHPSFSRAMEKIGGVKLKNNIGMANNVQ